MISLVVVLGTEVCKKHRHGDPKALKIVLPLVPGEVWIIDRETSKPAQSSDDVMVTSGTGKRWATNEVLRGQMATRPGWSRLSRRPQPNPRAARRLRLFRNPLGSPVLKAGFQPRCPRLPAVSRTVCSDILPPRSGVPSVHPDRAREQGGQGGLGGGEPCGISHGDRVGEPAGDCWPPCPG